jgi:hypothetical protein
MSSPGSSLQSEWKVGAQRTRLHASADLPPAGSLLNAQPPIVIEDDSPPPSPGSPSLQLTFGFAWPPRTSTAPSPHGPAATTRELDRGSKSASSPKGSSKANAPAAAAGQASPPSVVFIDSSESASSPSPHRAAPAQAKAVRSAPSPPNMRAKHSSMSTGPRPVGSTTAARDLPFVSQYTRSVTRTLPRHGPGAATRQSSTRSSPKSPPTPPANSSPALPTPLAHPVEPCGKIADPRLPTLSVHSSRWPSPPPNLLVCAPTTAHDQPHPATVLEPADVRNACTTAIRAGRASPHSEDLSDMRPVESILKKLHDVAHFASASLGSADSSHKSEDEAVPEPASTRPRRKSVDHETRSDNRPEQAKEPGLPPLPSLATLSFCPVVRVARLSLWCFGSSVRSLAGVCVCVCVCACECACVCACVPSLTSLFKWRSPPTPVSTSTRPKQYCGVCRVPVERGTFCVRCVRELGVCFCSLSTMECS